LQSIYSTEDTLALEPFPEKWKSFGWDVVEIDGHNHNEIFKSCKNDINSTNKPLCVIANTTKGKGVTFMENDNAWHHNILTKNKLLCNLTNDLCFKS
jgi:transketolase